MPPKADPLYVKVESICVEERKMTNLKYSTSSGAELKFELDDNKIAKLTKNGVLGLKQGVTTLRVYASLKGSRATASAKLTVTKSEYLELTDLPNEMSLYLIDKHIDEAIADGFFNKQSFQKHPDVEINIFGESIVVNENQIIAVKEGDSQLTFNLNGQVQVSKVKVRSILPESIQLPEYINPSQSNEETLKQYIVPSYYTGSADIKIQQNASGQADVFLNGEFMGEVKLDYEKQLSIIINPIYNASVQEGAIIVKKGQIAQVTFSVMLDGEYVNFALLKISAEGVEIKRELGYWLLSCDNCGKINISFENYSLQITVLAL